MKDIRIAVIGVGARAALAAVAHQPGRGSAVVTACDPDPRRDQRARELFGRDVAVVRTLDEVVESAPDAAFVLTPDDLHAEQAARLLAARIPVYVDQPLATTREAADRVLAAGLRSGTLLMVGHTLRHAPFLMQMRALIEQGLIGEVKAVWCRHFVGNGGDLYFKDWHAESARTNSLVVHRGVHDIDAIHFLAGARTERVGAFGQLAVYGDVTDRARHDGELVWDWHSQEHWPPSAQTRLNPDLDVEDISQANLQLAGGKLATYAQTMFAPDDWRSYTVIGTEGRLENFGDAAGGVIRVWDRRHSWSPNGDHEFRIGDAEGPRRAADPRVVAEFLRCVATGSAPSVSPVASRDAVATADAATVSLRSGGDVQQVPPARETLVSYFDRGQEQGQGPG